MTDNRYKLTDAQREAIRLAPTDTTHQALADRYGVSYQTVAKIRAGQGGECRRQKLTDEQRDAIRNAPYHTTHGRLADEYGVSYGTIAKLRAGQNGSHRRRKPERRLVRHLRKGSFRRTLLEAWGGPDYPAMHGIPLYRITAWLRRKIDRYRRNDTGKPTPPAAYDPAVLRLAHVPPRMDFLWRKCQIGDAELAKIKDAI